MRARGWWLDAAIVLLAFVLRVALLDVKPAHFDEGVNGWFVDQMTRNGFYHYDPSNFHGPLHFYVLFVAQTLFGRNLWALRLPTVLASTASVALLLGFRRFLPVRATRLAALAMVISPGCVFYGRDAIHESWLLLFLLIATWGAIGLWHGGTRRDLWAAGLGFTGMILTKETYAIHAIAFGLALLALWLWEKVSPSAEAARFPRSWVNRDLDHVIAAGALLVFFFYSGALLDWSSLPGIWQTFALWGHTGTGGESGHEKPWSYFLEMLSRYEWPAILGLAAIPALVRVRSDRAARFLALFGLAALAGYSLISYKTPWCVIVLVWPFYLVLGLATHRLLEVFDRWVVSAAIGVVCVASLGTCLLLNFRNFTDENEPYVYVQTLPEIALLLDPLRQLTRDDATNFHLEGHVMTADHHPLVWLLGDFTNVEMLDPEKDEPARWDGAFLLIDDSLTERAEEQLTGRYFRSALRLRGNSATNEVLYLNAANFAACFPGRAPEFVPSEKAAPDAEPPPDL